MLVTEDANSSFLDLKLTTVDCCGVRKFQVDFFLCGKIKEGTPFRLLCGEQWTSSAYV